MWQQSWDWPLPFPLKGLKWTKVHPVSTLQYKICVQLDEHVKQEVCVRVWNTESVSKYIVAKYSVVKYSEAKWAICTVYFRCHICKGGQLPKFDPLRSWRLATSVRNWKQVYKNWQLVYQNWQLVYENKSVGLKQCLRVQRINLRYRILNAPRDCRLVTN